MKMKFITYALSTIVWGVSSYGATSSREAFIPLKVIPKTVEAANSALIEAVITGTM